MSTGALLQSQLIQKAWQDPTFKSKLLSDPKGTIQEFLGISLPDHIKVRTVEENADEFYLVLPPNPSSVLEANVQPQAMWNP
ncbi:NHLP leader peptide family natural product precursor [Paenibacillus yonginensis]|uniref:NHLP leader peptide family natural product n=1 Tax=Paenibacillus yonginensis TaxID=1462996 RepID=A0A1B1MW24_9BACL|nr:NHLP leader peptide family RiPP precursor [Paenibacillus yonginensis]ANS73383.1 NHLP leader peptide family natural product precursor [Paenibacillus yonginensis]